MSIQESNLTVIDDELFGDPVGAAVAREQQAVSRRVPTAQGTKADDTPSDDYCGRCYRNGGFTYSTALDDMIEGCVPYLVKATEMNLDEAVSLMGAMLPNLKRWKEAQPAAR